MFATPNAATDVASKASSPTAAPPCVLLPSAIDTLNLSDPDEASAPIPPTTTVLLHNLVTWSVDESRGLIHAILNSPSPNAPAALFTRVSTSVTVDESEGFVAETLNFLVDLCDTINAPKPSSAPASSSPVSL